MKQLKMHSVDGVAQNVERIAALFPNCVTERKGEDGSVQRAIDFDMLRQELSRDIIDSGEERYQFTWPGKREAIRLANAPTNCTLRPVRDDSVDFDNTQNLYIEGDNLEVLKLLRETYLGKVKMIYIDPPYNTGSDFVYEDDFAQSYQDFKGKSGMFDEDGNMLLDNYERNNVSNGRFHTDWLNMMYSRLKISRDLLTVDGVICIQIDDNEYSNLKKISDEIFGIDNFLTTIVVKMSEPTGMKMAHASVRIPKLKEYILVYKKEKITKINPVRIPKDKWDNEYKSIVLNITEDEIKFIKYVRDNESREKGDIAKVNDILKKAEYRSLSEMYRENNLTSIEEKERFNYDNAWRIFQTVSMTGGAKLLADEKGDELGQLFYAIVTPEHRMYIIRGDYSREIDKPRIKILFADDYLTVNPCDFWQDIKTTGLDNEGFVDFRNGKKPMKLIERLIQLFSNDGDIIMDFFSGSGTTAHSVLEYNQKEKSKRAFILVQLPENLDSQLLSADPQTKKELTKTIKFLDSIKKPHTIAEIGKERIRLAGRQIRNAYPEAKDLDIGFRVLRLDSSNMEDVYYTPDKFDEANLFNMVDNVKSDRNEEDLLFQVMLELDVPLSATIKCEQIAGKKVFLVADGHLIATFDREVNETTVTEIAKQKPNFFVMRDASAANDNVLDNFEQIFKHYSPETICKIL